MSASNRTYDGTTTATLSGAATVSAFGSDVVSVTGRGSFADRNAGTGKAVSVSGYALTGADAGNYNLLQPTGLTADIGRATITVAGGVDGQTVRLTGGFGLSAAAGAGTYAGSTLTGLTVAVSGGSASSYTPPANGTLVIAPAPDTGQTVASGERTPGYDLASTADRALQQVLASRPDD